MADVLTGHPHETFFEGARNRNIGVPSPFFLVAATDASPRAKANSAFQCDGTADDVQIQEAVDALGAGGGLVILSEGTFTLAATITRTIDNVVIIGAGAATRLNNDASAALISAGSQNRWLLLDFETDAGGVTIGTGAGSIARIWDNSVYIEAVSTGATPTVNSPWNVIADPGDAGAIPVSSSGYVALVTAAAETRTLAAPLFIGQQLLLYMKTDGGNCVITCATTFNEAGNNTATYTDTGEMQLLIAVEEGSNLRWREVKNDGAALTTV